ncbi:RNA-directed DNA polymerase [Pseudomonas fluorescens]|uniref:RNA-directed DNA polymerase n=1 Tax=Pseudomonas fluorescens TaxID=294 RepID=UPI00058A6577|nr:RNA-directed DNA polymerase [Pseudomonas fluorescens]CEL29323.1 Reverse transcriptase (RNA-dependent DNA polymerase) [Pseudomonas fluorescens]
MQLQDLLAKGYFPIQLPVGFGTKRLADSIEQIKAVWDGAPGKQAGASQSEKFSVARSSYSRRTTSIPNPVSFYALAKEICEYWPQIRAHYDKSEISRSIPGTDGSLRAIELTKFSDLYEERVCQSAGARYALITDISSYFPTVYTHTIPWALHTKPVAKANKTKKTPEFFGNILDGRCMGTQDGQTIGLPIGPDTSHIIAEIIGVSIDEAICAELGGWPKGFRYVDDFTFFFNKREEAERALAIIIKCVSAYELQINASKTKIVEVRELVQKSWKYSLKKLTVSAKKRQQKDDIHHYFEMLFSLESRFKDESLVKYGLKQLSSSIVKKSNWAIAEAYFLKCGYGFPNTLQVITQILATYHRYGYPLNMNALGAFSRNLLELAAAANHHSETAWLLWLCKELSIHLDAPLIRQVLQMESSVCSLIALDLIHSNLVDGEVDLAALTGLPLTDQALKGNNWLLAYEGGRRLWLGNPDIAFIEADPCFAALLNADVSFYDQEARLPAIFQVKIEAAEAIDFDSDDEIDRDFEFDSMDEEYFDSAVTDTDEEGEEQGAAAAGKGNLAVDPEAPDDW